MNEFFKDYDLLLIPITAFPAFKADRWIPEDFDDTADIRSWTPFGYPFNITQQPAISVPCAFTSTGLPIGPQIIAPRFCDHRVLKAAYCFENARPVTFGRPLL
jgi:aspartyl-tRNA(Asn)/glutamyl-tRNA(Gln) amidotransferase subunit A